MTIRHLGTNYAVAPQIMPAEVERLGEQGFATIVSNRLDGEDTSQPSFDMIEAEARKYGLHALHLPVTPGKITQADLDAFAVLYASATKPVLGYCRTGMRAEALWEGTRRLGGVFR